MMTEEINVQKDTPVRHQVEEGELLTFVREVEGVEAKVIAVSPFEAAYVLKHRMPSNRNTRMSRVADMRRDMLTPGHWEMNGETFKFNFLGDAIDAKHRCTALASIHEGDVLLTKDGKPLLDDAENMITVGPNFTVDFLVVAGLSLTAQDTVDMGTKRTHSDILGMAGHAHSMTLAATAKKVWWWRRGDYMFRGNRNPTIGEVKEMLAAHPELVRSAEVANRVRPKFPYIPQSVLGLCHFLFTEIDQDLSALFFARLEDGADLRNGHPILTVRESLSRGGLGNTPRKNPEQYVAVLIRAWNAMRKNTELYKVQGVAPGKEMPMPK